MKPKRTLMLIITIAVTLFFIWLFFANLSDHALWNDEAFTSVMARNVLQFGYPRSFDGVNHVYPDWPSFNLPGTHVWIADTWFPIYLAALSFKLFGISTWSARIPFVIAGFFTLLIGLFFCSKYLRSKGIGIILVILLGTNAPFLLHSRQARYYALVILFSFSIFYLYHRIVTENKGCAWLSIIFSLLALTHYVAFLILFCNIWIMTLFLDRKEIRFDRLAKASILPSVVFLAWMLFSVVCMSDPSNFSVNSTLGGIKKNLEFQIRTINGYFVPIAFWLVILTVFRALKKINIFKPTAEEAKVFKRIGLFLICNIIFFSIFGARTMRYYVQYLPFLCILEAFLLYRIFKWKKILAVIIMFMIVFTDLPSKCNPAKIRSYFLDYLYELTHEYTGPLEAVCDHLALYAKPGDKIKILKGDLTVMAYHPELIVINDARYFKKDYPEWIVIRKYWNPIFEDMWRYKDSSYIEEGYLDVLDRYDKVLLPAVDSIRENVPDNLKEHFFKAPIVTPENQMVVYRLKKT
ncbi:MAG: glycosyltransferase family 39 protein [Candidatus Omnitrophota bacterium]